MELSFNKIKKLEVISVSDGKHLGRVCDVIFFYPENKIKGYFVTGGKGFSLTRQDVFIPVANVIKIGEDVILTDINKKPDKSQKPVCPSGQRRNNAHENCPPPCPPFPQDCCPPQCCPPDDRRSYDEYE